MFSSGFRLQDNEQIPRALSGHGIGRAITQGGARSELALGLYPFALNRAKVDAVPQKKSNGQERGAVQVEFAT